MKTSRPWKAGDGPVVFDDDPTIVVAPEKSSNLCGGLPSEDPVMQAARRRSEARVEVRVNERARQEELSLWSREPANQ